jgi:hypothetical protein
VTAFQGKYSIRSDIVIKEQVKNFRYLGCHFSYNREEDLQKKLFRFEHTCETIKRSLTNKTRKDTQLKLYKVMGLIFYIMDVRIGHSVEHG